MRQTIQDIIRGKFAYDQPVLLLEEEELILPVIENEVYHGSFHVHSSSEEPIRGLVTCEHPGIRIPSPEFDAVSAEINFEFSGQTGEDESGVFVVTSTSGEYLYPFYAQTSRHYLSTSIGKIKTLNDFYNLCKLNWEEAVDVFSSRYFCNIFQENSEYLELLYRSVTQLKCSSHELEEFLIGAGKKERCTFDVEGEDRTYYLTDSALQDSVLVNKKEWGYCDIRISCAEPFIELGKKQLQMYDFFGKHTDFSFRVLPERMHSGRNFAVITLENGFQKEQIRLECILGDLMQKHSAEWKRQNCSYQLESSFLNFQLGEKSETEWILESIEILRGILEEDSKNTWWNLYLAYLYFRAEDLDRMDAQMEQVPRNVRSAKTPLSGMYRYLSFLRERSESRASLLAHLEEIQTKYRRHPVLNWLILEVDDSLDRNLQRKYDTIRRFMKGGSRNPLFYLEAAKILQKYPEFLNTNDEFDCRLLGWMSKKDLLTSELALRVQSMAQGKQNFNRNYLHVLSKCYKQFGDVSYVKAICVYLIHTNSYGEKYFPWFKRGVEQHLKIAGLYEAYLLSWTRSQGALPEEIIRYFSMSSTLPSRKKATLYAYIVRNRERLANDWNVYLPVIQDFVEAELKKGHMNDDLAILYEEMRHTMSESEWELMKHDAESAYKVYVGETDFQAVRVMQNLPEFSVQRTAISGESAYVHLFCMPYVLLYEDRNGQLFVTGKECRVSKMLPGNRLPRYDTEETGRQKEKGKPAGMPDEKERLSEMAGSIDEMTDLVLDMREKGVDILANAQQLMVRMLFTGKLGTRHSEIFHILRHDPESRDLLLAYLSILCRDLMLYDTPLEPSAYLFLWERLSSREDENPYFRAAFLRMYAEQPTEEYADLAERLYRGYLFAGIYLPCFSDLPDALQFRYLMMGIRVLSYRDAPGETFYVQFSNGTKAPFAEVLPGLYTYPLKLMPGDACEYAVVDKDGQIRAKDYCCETSIPDAWKDTRYGRLGALGLGELNVPSQYAYAETCDLVHALFVPTEE